MAHSPRTKAQALTMLLLGNTVGYVAQQTGVPKQTISRWKQSEVPAMLRQAMASSPHLAALARSPLVRALAEQNGTKKR